jgi:Ca2+-binding RTX toxin-like protein
MKFRMNHFPRLAGRPIEGDDTNNLLEGGGNADILRGLGGNDTLGGLGGGDALSGGTGRDALWGGNGADVLLGGSGRDRIWGGAGDDTINGGTGDDIARGGAGADRFILSAGADVSYGNAGIDTLDTSGWSVGLRINLTATQRGYSSDAGPWTYVAANTIEANDGLVQTAFDIESVIGTGFNDRVWISAAGAEVAGLDGDDFLQVTGDATRVYGGDGNDGIGIDGNGAKAEGGAGNDRLTANYNDTNVTLDGGSGDDLVHVSGFSGSYYGGGGNDVMLFLTSDVNPDIVPSRLHVFGGAGADIFDFGYNQSGTMADFSVAEDRIDISIFVGDDIISWSMLQDMLSDSVHGAKLVVETTTHHNFTMYFTGVSASDLGMENFILYD